MPKSARLIRHAAAALVAPLLVTSSAWAQAEGGGRYTMMPTEGGFVRLDTQTGITSFCARKDAAWTCEAMPDAQQNLRDEVTRLETENKRLKGEIQQMEESLGLKPPSAGEATKPGEMSPDAGPPAPKAQIPTEKDVDRLFDYVEGMVKKFKERIERMEKDIPPPEPKPDSAPGATPEPGKGTPL